jgi:hypothetical protein
MASSSGCAIRRVIILSRIGGARSREREECLRFLGLVVGGEANGGGRTIRHRIVRAVLKLLSIAS